MNLFKIKISILLVSVSLLLPFHLSSQNNPEYSCGTTTSKESLEFYNSIRSEIAKNEKSFMAKSSSAKGAHDIKVEHIPIKAHIIRTSQGSDGLDVDDLKQTIDNLNAIFKDIYIQFSLSDNINYIDNDAFYHFNKSDESELTKNNYTEGALNIYFANNLKNESNNNICGYANITKNANIIFMQNSCAINDSSLAHEIGHFLSLIHTHGPNDNATTELVNGTNCDTDGDGVCDTPADPKLGSNNLDSCNYIGTATDANGDKYQPDTYNLMSYSYKGCRTRFSKQQQARMYAFFLYTKMQFFGATIEDVEESPLAQVKIYPNPVSDGTLNISSATDDSATHYQISNFYGQVLSQGPLTNKQIDVNNLSSGTYLLTLNNGKSRVVKKFIK
ncbi:zinc-dependent metalloprotease [Confluentibacter lentus]|uniref:zinc-dependent metalloprotease n=1 Tax=Confluentibacter lentus TaxID=1699412 RepID=UPI000C291392|nr:zinc-dependent metalloprotease [Confluentibacter lentus]